MRSCMDCGAASAIATGRCVRVCGAPDRPSTEIRCTCPAKGVTDTRRPLFRFPGLD